MFEIRYTGVDRAAGYRGMLVETHLDHLRINIHDTKPNSLGVHYVGLLWNDKCRIQKYTDTVRWGDNWYSALFSKFISILVERLLTQRNFEKQSGSDSCSKWWSRMSPEASESPEYIVTKFGVKWYHGALSAAPRVTNMATKSSVSDVAPSSRNRTLKSKDSWGGWV
jgi:hypothetical protein